MTEGPSKKVVQGTCLAGECGVFEFVWNLLFEKANLKFIESHDTADKKERLLSHWTYWAGRSQLNF